MKIWMTATAFAVTAFLSAGSAFASDFELERACTVAADASTGRVIYRKGDCDQRFSPVSSFKFPLAIMGFDSGLLKSPHDPVWTLRPEYNASAREQAFKTVDPTIWEKDSIVWFSQQLTRKMGQEKFADYVAKFKYGNMDVSGDQGKGNGLTHAWLMSSLTISPDEQIDFLLRFKGRKLPVSEQAYTLTEATIATFQGKDGWEVHGKTGSGSLRDTEGGINQRKPQGWFVGWARKGDREIVFARHVIGKKKSDTSGGLQARDTLLMDIPVIAANH
ncbi:class D beta-lactamase [Rhizobium sp. TRM95796]|uniref:class D beta-lactamase n=1 Tax=Rhizobium sp. TRM95796 TaxID=2979862 RepID=UPI0039957767